jgi:hypothetical protein
MSIKNILLYILYIIVVLILFYLIYLKYTVNKYTVNKYTIVCSRYDKNTKFLDKLSNNFDIKIIQKKKINYDKKYVDHEVINKANEATSYLSYIIKYYDNLPENMIFIHDENESWHHEGKITDNITKWIKEYEKSNGFYEFNNSKTDSCESCYNNNVFKELWEKLIPNKKLKNHKFDGKCCAQFIISKDTILSNSIDLYIFFFNWLVNNTRGEGNGNPDDLYSGNRTGRYSEWLWKAIFTLNM